MQVEEITYNRDQGLFILKAGRKSYAISYDFYLAQDLHVDMELDASQLQALEAEDAWNRAYATALRFANYQMRTRREVERRLYRDHIPQETIQAILDKLEDLHLLDDARYAKAFAEEKAGRSAWSQRKIQARLFEKGLAREDIDQALAALPEGSEAENIQRLLDGTYARLDLSQQKDFDKVYRGLMSKGFPSSLVLSLMRDRRDQLQAEEDSD